MYEERLEAWITGPKLFLEAIGTAHFAAEIGEQLAWLTGTLFYTSRHLGIAYCTPSITSIKKFQSLETSAESNSSSCRIDFSVHLPEDRSVAHNGQCWHDMFEQLTVIYGYPIQQRDHSESGLEVPLNVMLGLMGTRTLNIFHDKIFIKTFSSMLVPTGRRENSIMWHLLFKNDGQRISYLESVDDHLNTIRLSEVETARHFVGWCSDVNFNAGKDS